MLSFTFLCRRGGACGRTSTVGSSDPQLKLGMDSTQVSSAFLGWCEGQLRQLAGNIDVQTFVAFLLDIESVGEVVEYVSELFGDDDKARRFAHAFMEKRVTAMGSQRVARAGPPTVDDSWQQQPKRKTTNKKKKKEFQKLDSSMLGYHVAAGSNVNRGEIDFGQ